MSSKISHTGWSTVCSNTILRLHDGLRVLFLLVWEPLFHSPHALPSSPAFALLEPSLLSLSPPFWPEEPLSITLTAFHTHEQEPLSYPPAQLSSGWVGLQKARFADKRSAFFPTKSPPPFPTLVEVSMQYLWITKRRERKKDVKKNAKKSLLYLCMKSAGCSINIQRPFFLWKSLLFLLGKPLFCLVNIVYCTFFCESEWRKKGGKRGGSSKVLFFPGPPLSLPSHHISPPSFHRQTWTIPFGQKEPFFQEEPDQTHYHNQC